MPGVSIGDGAVVGAASVVTKDVAPGLFVSVIRHTHYGRDSILIMNP